MKQEADTTNNVNESSSKKSKEAEKLNKKLEEIIKWKYEEISIFQNLKLEDFFFEKKIYEKVILDVSQNRWTKISITVGV